MFKNINLNLKYMNFFLTNKQIVNGQKYNIQTFRANLIGDLLKMQPLSLQSKMSIESLA